MNINKKQKSLSLRNLVPQKMALEEENFRRICFDDEEVDARARIRQPSLTSMNRILSRSRESSSRAIGTRLSSFRTVTSRSILNEDDDEEESLHIMIERMLGNTSSLHTDNKNQIENRSTK